ncbi:MAG: site-2 protease family protein [Chloroflexota bacterium]
MAFDLDIPTLIARMVVLVVAFTIHELAHALTADYLGDSTPRQMGRITLNPLAHLDPLGTIALLIAGFGWAKPVLVNPQNLRGNPRTSMAIVALAGPLSNLFLAALVIQPLRLGWLDNLILGDDSNWASLSLFMFEFIFINIILAVFNFIPLPPLDGFKILSGILPPNLAYQLRPLEQYGSLILMALIFLLPAVGVDVIGVLLGEAAGFIFNLLIQ